MVLRGRRASAVTFAVLASVFAASLPQRAEARVGTQVVELDSTTLHDFLRQNDRALLDFYDPSDSNWQEWNLELQAAMRTIRDVGSSVPVAKVNVLKEKELMKQFVPNGPFPQLMWFLHGEPTSYHRSFRKSKHISDFVLALDRDPMQEFSSEEQVRETVNRAVWAQVPRDSAAFKVLSIVAQKHMDTTAFTFKSSSKTEIRWLADESHDRGRQQGHSVFEGEVTVENLERWVRGHLMKSEALPEAQEGDSIPVVGATFEDTILRNDKDVFLLIYAPWCGWSRKILPTWESLARRAASIPHLVVAKMDGDLNDSPYPEDFSWTAYPTVFFIKAGTRRPIVFHGNRTEARLLEFAREHGSQNISEELDAAIMGSPGVVSDNPEWEL